MARANRTPQQIVFERPKDVWRRRGKGRTQHYADIERGVFPTPILIGGRATAHPKHETDAVLAAQMAGANEDELRALVRELIEARRDLARELAVAHVSSSRRRGATKTSLKNQAHMREQVQRKAEADA